MITPANAIVSTTVIRLLSIEIQLCIPPNPITPSRKVTNAKINTMKSGCSPLMAIVKLPNPFDEAATRNNTTHPIEAIKEPLFILYT